MNKLKRLICFAAGFAAVFLAITLGTETHAIAQAVRVISAQCCEYGTPPQSMRLIDLGKHQQQFATQVFDSIDSGVSSPVVAYFEAGETPIVRAPGIGGDLAATLSGYYISLP
jgi:hypothetical protein